MKKESLVIDGCSFVDKNFTKLTDEVLNSNLDAFFLTIPGETEGFFSSTDRIGMIHNLADDTEKKLTVIRRTEDILAAKKEGKKGIILTFQNPHSIENSINKLRVFYELGVRVIQMTYNKANYIGTGCVETVDGGLTDFGKAMLKSMNNMGILADISHCGYKTGIDVIKYSEKPVVASHASVKIITDNVRNKTDDTLKLLKENGGVIGLCPWGPLCWKEKEAKRPTLNDYIEHIEYVIDLIGIDHVGFGSDGVIDGFKDEEGLLEQSTLYNSVVGKYNSALGLDPATRHAENIEGPWLVQNVMDALKSKGYSDEDIYKFTGGNFMRVLYKVWK